MCPKLFIFREFYFLILELIGGPHHIYYPSKLLSTKTKEFIINELGKKKGTSQYQKLRMSKKKIKNMDDLHFVPNNILTRFFKKLTKYKNDYQ